MLGDGLVKVEDSQVGLVEHDVDAAQVVGEHGGGVVGHSLLRHLLVVLHSQTQELGRLPVVPLDIFEVGSAMAIGHKSPKVGNLSFA